MSTTRELIDDAAGRLRALGIDTPRLDAELLLAMAIGVDRTAVVAHSDAPVGADHERAFLAAVERRLQDEPVAYIRGLREFHGIALSVDQRALIPRPESEALVDLALVELMRRLGSVPAVPDDEPILESERVRVVDVGTGSGALAIAIAVGLRARRVRPDLVSILATDLWPDALDLARENAVAHGVGDRLRFAVADLLPEDETPFALIVANLPYIRSDDLAALPAAVLHEPAAALDGGPDGLAVIDRLLGRLPAALQPGGMALLEIGADQGASAAEHIEDHLPGWPARIETDLAGLPRIAVVERPSLTEGPA